MDGPKALCGILALVGIAIEVAPASAQDFDAVQIEATDLGHGLHMLTGRGGNMLVSLGKDGALLIDDQFAPLVPRIQAAIEKLGGDRVHFVLNTHWHFDHTGGNEALGRAGALIVAHEEVRARMSRENVSTVFDRTTPPAPDAALPIVTFADRMSLHWNGLELRLLHVDPAHTDGDAIVHFPGADVIHTGDVWFNGSYPFIDVDSGGSVNGLIAAVERIAALADDDTRIVPGHGPLSDRAALLGYLDMLVKVRDAVRAAIAAGQSREAILASRPSAAWDERWGGGFMSSEQFVGLVHRSLTQD